MKSMTNHGTQKRVSFDPSWKPILECAALEVFEMMAGVRLDPIAQPQGEPSGDQTAMVGLAGALCGMLTLRCRKPTARRLASLMLGADAASNSNAERDALGELCNMIAGNFKSKISTLADDCLLSVPTVVSGEDYSLQTVEPLDSTTTALLFEGATIWVSLMIHL